MAEEKTGVYICSGCGVGDRLDAEALSKTVEEEHNPAVLKTHPCLCGEEGGALIAGDVEAEGLSKLCVAACSARVFHDRFSFGEALVERVNLREHAAWICETNDEDARMLGEDYLRMGLARLAKRLPLEPCFEESVEKRLLVVGGGTTGMRAALAAARIGRPSTIVEKSDRLGGEALSLYRLLPFEKPYDGERDPEEVVGGMVCEINASDLIDVRLGEEPVCIEGAPGRFEVSLSGGASFRAGAIVQATGVRAYDASRLGALGFGSSPDVVTGRDLERLAGEAGPGPIKRPSDGAAARSVVFVQCAGSRDAEHLPYCSAVCCLTSLKQARCIRELDPEAKVFIVYRDMRTGGLYEAYYKKAQDDPGIFLTKGSVTAVAPAEGSDLINVDADDTLLGQSIRIEADLVVLQTGLVPTTLDLHLTREDRLRKIEEHVEEQKKAGGDGDAARKEKEAELGPPPGILNLSYRQGPDLPVGEYGFPDSDFVCFPYESRRTGIYAAGPLKHPMTPAQAATDAAGATLKAVQCVELTEKGMAVHPRAGDASYPDFFLQRCTQCKRCTEECPFAALDEDEKGTPKPNPSRCRRCGVCMGACPERIISFKDYSVDIIASSIKAIEVPDEEEEKPRVIAFICENDAYPALDLAGQARLKLSPFVRFIPVRCLGSVNVVWIADSLSNGVDGVMLFGCKYGEDYQCHFIKGSELADRRMENVKEALERLVLEPERVVLHQLALTDYDKIPTLVEEFMEAIEEAGPNPYKGM